MTSYAPSVQPGWLRRNRGFLAVAVALLAVLVALGLLTAGGRSGELDPAAYDPSGAHAVAALLEGQGVTVHRTADLPATQGLADANATVFVPLPRQLSTEELQAVADLPGELVVAGAAPHLLPLLDDSVTSKGDEHVTARDPGCAVPVAVRAGRAEVGGFTYRGPACYGGALLLRPASHLTLLGSAEMLQNDHLAHEGNAALALGLLGQHRSLVWLVPDPARAALGQRPVTDPEELLPGWVSAVETQLVVALVVLVIWRARRLGRVVPEPLPVVVRAAEAVEGRGRLYRAARARGTAAEELRAGTRHRLGPRVGAGRGATRETLVTALAGHTGRTPEQVTALLYGPEPADDAALVRLVDDLDALVREVTGA